jgi:hypothetical protein
VFYCVRFPARESKGARRLMQTMAMPSSDRESIGFGAESFCPHFAESGAGSSECVKVAHGQIQSRLVPLKAG